MRKTFAIILALILVLAMVPAVAFAAGTTHYASTSAELASDITASASGDTIYLYNGTYTLPATTIDKDLTITGESESSVTIKPTADISTQLVQVAESYTLNISNLTIDGSGKNVSKAIDAEGTLKAEHLIIKNIAAPGQDGLGIFIGNSGNADIKNVEMSGIGRIGVYTRGPLTVDGFKYTGKGIGAGNLDYGIEAGSKPTTAPYTVSITNAVITDCSNICDYEAKSAGIYIETWSYTKGGGDHFLITATITNTTISNCFVGVQGGYTESADAHYTTSTIDDWSNTTIRNSNFTGNTYDLRLSGNGTGTISAESCYFGGGGPALFAGTDPVTVTNTSATPIPMSQNTDVSAGVEPSYIIVIPSAVDFGTLVKNNGIASQDFTVSATDVVVEDGHKVALGLTAGNKFIMNDKDGMGASTLTFVLKDGSTPANQVAAGHQFTSFTADGSYKGSVSVDTAAITKAGSYKGTMDFVISYN